MSNNTPQDATVAALAARGLQIRSSTFYAGIGENGLINGDSALAQFIAFRQARQTMNQDEAKLMQTQADQIGLLIELVRSLTEVVDQQGDRLAKLTDKVAELELRIGPLDDLKTGPASASFSPDCFPENSTLAQSRPVFRKTGHGP